MRVIRVHHRDHVAVGIFKARAQRVALAGPAPVANDGRAGGFGQLGGPIRRSVVNDDDLDLPALQRRKNFLHVLENHRKRDFLVPGWDDDRNLAHRYQWPTYRLGLFLSAAAVETSGLRPTTVLKAMRVRRPASTATGEKPFRRSTS